MKNYLTIILLVIFSANSYAQVGGNQVYQNSNNRSQSPVSINKSSIVSTASNLTINASVLLNKEADYYLMTVGVKQEAKTVIECNQQLNQRINAFLSDLSKAGIKGEDVYADFISQTKLYDHSIESNVITEFFDGFEIRKNLIIKLKELALIDEIIELASKQEIFDIVKVEYFNDDLDQIYDELFDEAMKIIENRKARFSAHSSFNVTDRYRIIQDHFGIHNPQNMYKQYNEAFESSVVNTHYSGNYIKESVRKDKTFFYESAQNSLAVDKVIDEISPVVGIQYSLQVSIIYDLVR
ncbi:MAG: SIMPL domain-containing protein [Lewinella sp.]|uniref:SIMPL domain-containing protein n=1 Tax=Lewinella sp. TaxID=2004506 RepID=UPI003D6C69EC